MLVEYKGLLVAPWHVERISGDDVVVERVAAPSTALFTGKISLMTSVPLTSSQFDRNRSDSI